MKHVYVPQNSGDESVANHHGLRVSTWFDDAYTTAIQD